MAKKAAKKTVEKTSYVTREQIQEKLEKTLSDLKPLLGEKKFKRRMKKAGKLICSGLHKKAKDVVMTTKKPKAAEAPIK